MEAAIRSAMITSFEEYVTGLDKADVSQFPITLRNLTMKPPKVNEELEDTPFTLDDGSIGIVKITPGWNGSVAVEVSGIKVNLSFSPVKAAKLAMRPADPVYNTEEIFMTGAYAPPPPPTNVAPRYCGNHDTSEKRTKGVARECGCKTCGITFMTTYSETCLCSGCSDFEKRCIICGSGADKAGSYIPANSQNQKPAESEKLPAPPPGNGSAGLINNPSGLPWAAGGSFAKAHTPRPNGNLQPTDSIPVKQTAPEPASMIMNSSELNNAVAQMEGQRQGQQGPPGGKGKGKGQGKGKGKRPPQRPPQKDDDNPFVAFLKNLNCGQALGLDDDDEPSAGPPNRGPPPGARAGRYGQVGLS